MRGCPSASPQHLRVPRHLHPLVSLLKGGLAALRRCTSHAHSGIWGSWMARQALCNGGLWSQMCHCVHVCVHVSAVHTSECTHVCSCVNTCACVAAAIPGPLLPSPNCLCCLHFLPRLHPSTSQFVPRAISQLTLGALTCTASGKWAVSSRTHHPAPHQSPTLGFQVPPRMCSFVP